MPPGFEADQPRGARAPPPPLGDRWNLPRPGGQSPTQTEHLPPKTSQLGPAFLQLVLSNSIQIPPPTTSISTQPRLLTPVSMGSPSARHVSPYTFVLHTARPSVLRPVPLTPKSSHSDQSRPAVSLHLQSRTNTLKHLSPRLSRTPINVHTYVFPLLRSSYTPDRGSPYPLDRRHTQILAPIHGPDHPPSTVGARRGRLFTSPPALVPVDCRH